MKKEEKPQTGLWVKPDKNTWPKLLNIIHLVQITIVENQPKPKSATKEETTMTEY